MKHQFRTMLQLQIGFNKSLDAAWPENPVIERDDVSAMVEEFGEYLGHTGYHWWKKTAANERQAMMELIDIWHFMMSDNISFMDYEKVSVEEVVERLTGFYVDSWTEITQWASVPTNAEVIQADKKGLQFLTGAAINNMAERTVDTYIEGTTKLFLLMTAWGITFEKLYAMYVGKNALNKFRQLNGYKQGTYKKTWLDGREDNEHLFDLIETQAGAIAEASDPFAYVIDQLTHAYGVAA